MQAYVYNHASQIMVSFDNAQVWYLLTVKYFINMSFDRHSPTKAISLCVPESEVSLCGRLVVTTMTSFLTLSVHQFSLEQLSNTQICFLSIQ